ncbi:MAG TPA: hypothetical protein VD905_05105 [Flavobacteriales bacterium]|nr:hypothetical protein [Flavobacteriales bacterium]
MEKEVIVTLQKNTVTKPVKNAPGCCGGPAQSNENACCALDEQKKSEGEPGCGCNTNTDKSTPGCC